MTFRRRKSRTDQALELFGTYLKLKAASKAAKGAKKAAKGTAAYKVAKKTPALKRVPVVAGAAAAAFAATRAIRNRGEHTATA